MSSKARLPLVPNQPSATSAPQRASNASLVRAAGGRVLVSASDQASGEAASRFASAVLERIRAHCGPGCASISSQAQPPSAPREALLTVRIGVRARSARDSAADLELARDDGLIATLIGDWIGAQIQDVSAKGSATPAKNPRA